MSAWTCFAYLCIVFLSILPIVCLLGFLHVENVSCVCFSVLCFRHMFYGLNKCTVFHICVL